MTPEEFIRARLDEDERVARACIDSSGNLSWFDSLVRASGDHTIRTSPGNRPVAHIRLADSEAHDGRTLNSDACAEHIARQDPSRALREVAAKRAILARHKPLQGVYGSCCAWCSDDVDAPRLNKPWPCEDVRDLIAVWSDHPDYDPSWGPGR